MSILSSAMEFAILDTMQKDGLKHKVFRDEDALIADVYDRKG